MSDIDIARAARADDYEIRLMAHCVWESQAFARAWELTRGGEVMYLPRHKSLWRTMHTVWREHVRGGDLTGPTFALALNDYAHAQPAPYGGDGTLRDYLDARGTLNAAGLLTEVCKPGGGALQTVDQLARPIVAAHQKRAIRRACVELAGLLEPDEYGQTRVEPDEALARLATLSREMSTMTTGEDPTAPKVVADSLRRYVRELATGERVRYSTGIAPIDALIRWEPGSYNILAAYSGHGKTTLASAILAGLCDQPHAGADAFVANVHQCEVQQHAQCARVLAAYVNRRAADDRHRLGEHHMLQVDNLGESARPHVMARMDRALSEWFERSDIYLERSGAIDINAVEMRAQTLRATHPGRPLVIVVDYIQRVMIPESPRLDERTRIGMVSARLQALAQTTGAVLIVLSQYTDTGSAQVPIPMPLAEQVRGSKDIRNDADNVISFHRPWAFAGGELVSCGVIEISKGRYTPPSHVLVRADMGMNTFEAWHGDVPDIPGLSTRRIEAPEEW